MKIIFVTPKEVVVVKEVKRTLTELTVEEITDNSSRKEVKAFTLELGMFTLWTGDQYDAIGQWTDADAQARILEILE
jgi:ABC-type uncharacterized transport system permease subunit